jgi:hypothetical protein
MKRFHGDIAKISSSLHTFAWEVFKPRVIKQEEIGEHQKPCCEISSLLHGR